MADVICEPGGHPMASQRALVAAALEWAVPQAIQAPGPPAGELAAQVAGLLEEHGDLAWLAVRAHADPGGLTRLARGLAALACRPGGVTFLGTTWVAIPAAAEARAA